MRAYAARLSIRAQLMLVLVLLTGCSTVFVALLAYRMSRRAVREYAAQVLAGAAADRKQRVLELFARRHEQLTNLLVNVELNCGVSGAMNGVCAREQMEDFAAQEHARCVAIQTHRRRPLLVGQCDEAALPERAGLFFLPATKTYALHDVNAEYGSSGSIVFADDDVRALFAAYGVGRGGRVYFVSPADPLASSTCGAAREGEIVRSISPLPELHGGCVVAEMPQREAVATSVNLMNAAFLGAAAWGAIALLLAYMVARWMTAPIERLRQRALALQAGNFEAPVPVSGPAEVREFGRTFAAMAAALKRSRALLLEQERLQATSQMAASLAHQIHNPLTSVTYSLALLGRDSGLSERARELVGIGREEAERIARISRQLLGLYAAEASSRCRIGDVLQRVLEHESERLSGRPLPVRLKVNSDAEVRAVEPELRHALINLLHNALRALPPGRCVTLHAYTSRAWHDPALRGVRVVVADPGPGIPGAQLAKAAEPFTSTTARGSGLGLWVARAIVRKHGGFMQVRTSTRPGRSGTCVNVFLPAA